VEFEFDSNKSDLNLEKQGIDFEQIQKMWDGKIVAAPSRNSLEERWLAVGCLESNFWTVIITLRNNKIRIISARRS
jgi:uncharacterized protein